MIARSTSVQTLDELRDYVNETLCRYDQLLPGAFPMSHRTLVRAGKPCGVYFCLHGPRAVKYTAIWETRQHTILFYGPTGERFQKVQLVDAPVLD
jgi:hypothetical protein